MAVIKVGTATENALHAARAAGGLKNLKTNGDERVGVEIVHSACEDLVAAGVIDPTKVTRYALQNASSISSLMLTTEAMVCEIPEKKSASMQGGEHGGGHGMDY